MPVATIGHGTPHRRWSKYFMSDRKECICEAKTSFGSEYSSSTFEYNQTGERLTIRGFIVVHFFIVHFQDIQLFISYDN